MKKGTIKEIGPQAIDSQERMIIFFGEEATDTLREYSVIQTIPDSQALVVKKGIRSLLVIRPIKSNM